MSRERMDDPASAHILDAFGTTETIEEGLAKEARRASRKKVETLTPEFLDKKAESYTYAEALEQVKARRKRFQEVRLGQETAAVRIRTRDPILVTPIGDVHFGSVYTDVERFERDVQRIEEHNGQFCILMSNLIDNAIPAKFPNNLLTNEIHPEEQVIAMRQKVKELEEKGKVIAAITSPCHEGWTWNVAGQDVNRLLFEGRRFPILDNGGELNLKVGEEGKEQDYKIVLYHQIGRFESQLNKSNALQRMQQLRHQEADVIIGAHKHVAEALHTYVGEDEATRKDKVFLRSGTDKLEDQFLRGRGFTSGEPAGASVMLWPDEKRMQPFLDLGTATEVHEAVKLRRVVERGKKKRKK